MTKIRIHESKEYEINDLSINHPYSFDTRLIQHIHCVDGTIIRLDTKEQFSGKTKIKTLSDLELENIIKKNGVNAIV